MEEIMKEFGDANFATHAIAFVIGFFLGKKVARMGFIFMLILAVGVYFVYQSYTGDPGQ